MTRRPTAATCWRIAPFARSMKAALIGQPVAASDHASTPILFDHLGIEQRGQWHPTGLRGGTLSLPARWLHPGPEVGQKRGGICLESVGEEEGHTTGRSHLH